MVRWSDGLYGGLIAGLVSALFFLFVGGAIIHEPFLGGYFVRFSVGIFGSRIESLPLLGLLFGLFFHFLSAAIFGIIYAAIAARFKPSWTAPTSVLCGLCYGLFMYFITEDVAVPVLRAVSYTPLWEALLGNVLFQGVVISEYITIAHRRHLAGLA
ncbi:MAG TPA: hypothetical protein VIJ64_02530 [Candidatus Lustribacter sp.]